MQWVKIPLVLAAVGVLVFLFRHPIMTLLANTPAFLSPRVSGLGRVLHHAREDAPAPGTKRAKEA